MKYKADTKKMEYTKEDIETFKTDKEACPAHLLGSTDKEYIQWMQKLNWQPPNIIIEAEKPKNRADDEITVPRRYLLHTKRTPFHTTWVMINKGLGLIKCNNCKINTSLATSGDPPDVCPCCGLPTDKKQPIMP
ncbi:MAG: hypothetical protein COU51_01810 [Parcubacteria group bacterium CG10_big_fil_rev_8_21_14_0_10_36_14]|nr:MAG: hypothetical protein COU51_01810 [Parcubacteria group bacterium CG10_big_fil_rev_8_21_14_0_10_36_14]